MQLIYRWDIGSQILDAALQQIKQFLADPGELEKEENVSMCVAVKRRKVEPSKKRSKKIHKKIINKNLQKKDCCTMEKSFNLATALFYLIF